MIGFTGKGLQKRVLWFDHYRVPVAGAMQAQEASCDDGADWNLTPVGVGGARDRAMRAEACRFWREAKAFAPDTDLSDPAAALSVVAHDGEEMIATSSLRMVRVPALRRNFAMLRRFVAPRWRGTGLREALAAENFRLAEAEAANADDAALPAGVLTICSGEDCAPLPVDAAGFLLSAYTPGRDQVRLRWFGHVRIPAARLDLSA